MQYFRSFFALTVLCLSSLSFAGSEFPNQAQDEVVADQCQFYIDSFGDAHQLIIGSRWIQADISVNQTMDDVTILNIGAKVVYFDPQKKNEEVEIQLSRPVKPGRFTHQIPYQGEERPIRSFNFFMDVRDRDGVITRYWLVDSETGYSPESVFFGYPFSYKKLDSALGITYTLPPSPIMLNREKCIKAM